MEFIKSYITDYQKFKRRVRDAGLGNDMDANNYWRYLLGNNKYLQTKTLKKMRSSNVKIDDLNALQSLIKATV